jgi:hypothetical protein
LGRSAGADSACVFAESDIAHVVQAVFDAPVTAPAFSDPAGIGLPAIKARDRVVGFDRSFTLAKGGANATTDLGQSWPIQMGYDARA